MHDELLAKEADAKPTSPRVAIVLGADGRIAFGVAAGARAILALA